MFPDATVYDERALLGALYDAQVPASVGWADDPAVEAWSIVEGGGTARAVEGGLAMPDAAAPLRDNPLLAGAAVAWPSDRWRDEYGAGCRWSDPGAGDPVRVRRVVDLPERW